MTHRRGVRGGSEGLGSRAGLGGEETRGIAEEGVGVDGDRGGVSVLPDVLGFD